MQVHAAVAVSTRRPPGSGMVPPLKALTLLLLLPSRAVTDNVTIYKIVWAQALALRCRDGVVCHGITYVNLKEGRSFLGDADWLLLIRSKRCSDLMKEQYAPFRYKAALVISAQKKFLHKAGFVRI